MHSGCFACVQPLDICPFSTGTKNCRYKDVLLPAAFSAFIFRKTDLYHLYADNTTPDGTLLTSVWDREGLAGFLNWCITMDRWAGMKCCKVVPVFYDLMKRG